MIRHEDNQADKQVIHIEETYTHRQEKEYARVYFDMPKGVEALEVKLYVNNDDDIIDLGLEDTMGLRGWSGGARRHLILREDWAVNGYGYGNFHEGQWAVLLGLYKIKNQSTVQLEIEIHLKKPRWYKGDLHMHSTHSDGAYHIQQVLEHAKGEGLDYVALTDHNTFSQNQDYQRQKDLVIIEGVELTTYHGHVNFWGHPRPISHFACGDEKDMDGYVKEGRDKGAMVSVNHPFHTESWNYGLERYNFQYMEVWNGPWSEANEKALQWWNHQLSLGKNIVVVGGSDTHGDDGVRWYGRPTTWIKSQGFSSEGMLQGIREGCVCVTANPSSARLELALGPVNMGSTYYPTEEEKTALLTMDYRYAAGEVLKLYNHTGCIQEIPLDGEMGHMELQVSLDTPFYRAELEKDGQMIAISNPVYIRTRSNHNYG